MKVLGLTGGIGMGKSTAARFFRECGVQVVDTDELAHKLVELGQPALAEIQMVFGKSIVAPDGRLRRESLAQIIFTDPVARQKLEAILHPRIREGWLAQIESWRREDHPLAVVVIPLLFETQAESHFNKTICAACSGTTQHRRLLERGWTPGQIQQRIAAQWPIEQKIARADFVIWTEGSLAAHAEQIERILLLAQ
ncbi:MAG TPA: dephospho-CoA kinase [Candidatus Saccharimonadales bacterium]|nr:dephospho-CoA kinase [Candidatus Saccharimonadales bacterium]